MAAVVKKLVQEPQAEAWPDVAAKSHRSIKTKSLRQKTVQRQPKPNAQCRKPKPASVRQNEKWPQHVAAAVRGMDSRWQLPTASDAVDVAAALATVSTRLSWRGMSIGSQGCYGNIWESATHLFKCVCVISIRVRLRCLYAMLCAAKSQR